MNPLIHEDTLSQVIHNWLYTFPIWQEHDNVEPILSQIAPPLWLTRFHPPWVNGRSHRVVQRNHSHCRLSPMRGSHPHCNYHFNTLILYLLFNKWSLNHSNGFRTKHTSDQSHRSNHIYITCSQPKFTACNRAPRSDNNPIPIYGS